MMSATNSTHSAIPMHARIWLTPGKFNWAVKVCEAWSTDADVVIWEVLTGATIRTWIKTAAVQVNTTGSTLQMFQSHTTN